MNYVFLIQLPIKKICAKVRSLLVQSQLYLENMTRPKTHTRVCISIFEILFQFFKFDRLLDFKISNLWQIKLVIAKIVNKFE